MEGNGFKGMKEGWMDGWMDGKMPYTPFELPMNE
jgi:hypothetical protein